MYVRQFIGGGLLATSLLMAPLFACGAERTAGPKLLTLRDAVLLAVRNNPAVRNAYLQRVTDKFALEIAQDEFAPGLEFDAAGNFQRGAGPDYSVKPSAHWKTALGTSFSADYTQALQNERRKTLTLRAEQPLLRGFGPKVVLANLHNAIDREAVNYLALRSQVMATITQTIQAYHALMRAYSSLKVQERALEQSIKVLDDYKLKFKLGTLPHVSIIEQQSQVADLRLAVETAKNSIKSARHALLVLLGLDPRSPIVISDKLDTFKSYDLNLEKSVHTALAYNILYRQALIGLRANYRAITTAKNNKLWDLTLSGEISVSEDANTHKKTSRSAALNLSIPIDDLGRKVDLINAKIALKQAKISLQQQRDRLMVQVTDAINDLTSQRKQLALRKERVALTEKTYEAALLKHKHGLTSAFEVVRQQNTLINARLELISLEISYMDRQASFRELLGQTLNDWHIRVLDPKGEEE